MDAPSSTSTPSGTDSPLSEAPKLLVNLPSRGFFSTHVISSNLGGLRVYVCDRDTAPPGLLKPLWMGGLKEPSPINTLLLDTALKSSASVQEYHNLTVERLRALLKERGLSVKGKKDELITRLREAED